MENQKMKNVGGCMAGQLAYGMKVGIIRLQMIREGRSLYGLGPFSEPKTAVDFMNPFFKGTDREMLVVVSLDTKLMPLAVECAAVGGRSFCPVDIPNLFKHPLLNNAAYIMCFHNHLSGDTEPSQDDFRITERIRKAGELLGIPLTDHIILGDGIYYSFRKQGMFAVAEQGEMMA